MRSKTIEARSAAKGSEHSRARIAGLRTSPARAGSTVLAAKPMAVARYEGHQGTRPTGLRIQTQRSARIAKVDNEIAALAAIQPGDAARIEAAISERWTRE